MKLCGCGVQIGHGYLIETDTTAPLNQASYVVMRQAAGNGAAMLKNPL
jgi:hypothetical protein